MEEKERKVRENLLNERENRREETKKENEGKETSLFSRVLRDSTPRYVGPSVGPSVGRAFRVCGSRPQALVTSSTAPAHLHATRVVMYPALLLKKLI